MNRDISKTERSSLADKLVADLNNTTVGANLHTFQNDFEPSPLSVIADFTENDYPGYVKKTAMAAFAKVYESQSGDYRVYLPTQQVFTAGTLTATQRIIGCYITDSTDVTLFGWQKFDPPLAMANSGDSVIIDVELRIPVDAGSSDV